MTEAQKDALSLECEGLKRIVAERRRQIEKEQWTPEHDDEHVACELSRAAICYIDPAARINGRDPWPWWSQEDVSGGRGDCPVWGHVKEWYKPDEDPDGIRDLEKAGALIAAEIARRLRARARREAGIEGKRK